MVIRVGTFVVATSVAKENVAIKIATTNDIRKEDAEMVYARTSDIRTTFEPTPLHKISFRAGYQIGKLKHSAAVVRKKLRIAKWGTRVVKFLGLKTSAKLSWKGFKFKRKLDKLRMKLQKTATPLHQDIEQGIPARQLMQ